jgi:hypothetical protein
MSDGPFFKERRVLPPDHPERARQRIKDRLGFTDEDFKAMRRPYDDPRRTPSKRALLETIRLALEAEGKSI